MIKQNAYLYLVVLCATALSLSSDVKAGDNSSQKLLSAEEYLRCINCPNCKSMIARLQIELKSMIAIKSRRQEIVNQHKNQDTLNSAFGQYALSRLDNSFIEEAKIRKILTEYEATIAAHQTSLAKPEHKSQ